MSDDAISKVAGAFSLRNRSLAAASAAVLLGLFSTAAWANKLEIKTLSTRPDAVTGGNVLLQISIPRGGSQQGLTVTANGQDVTSAFHVDPNNSAVLRGLVQNLRDGQNTIVARAGRHGGSSTLKVINHPISGPVFSGPHQQPFVCETSSFPLAVINGTLGPPLDENCSALTRIDYVYKSTDGTYKPMPAPTVPPVGDLATTTTSAGLTVPFIVRIESGTINRAIYQIAILHNPATDPPPHPSRPPAAWNGRLTYTFGGGCNAAYHQGRSTGGVVNELISQDWFLNRGYAVASASLNVFGNNCNDVTSAETMMMVKEHFIESFGVPLYTVGNGASGGSMQQHLIAQNYPGLLDGILPSYSYPDIFSVIPPTVDCSLLNRAFNSSTQPWTAQQKTAVSGYATWATCESWMSTFSPGWVTAANGCDPGVPAALVYDPVSNPRGARCTVHDNTVNVFGRDPKSGFARGPYDNVGVQYGLAALNAGAISAEQFVELNERVGGYDVDGNLVASRTVGDRKALQRAYRTGRVNSGAGSLTTVPIINVRAYLDPFGDIHDHVRSFMLRDRLIAANGHARNQVIFTAASSGNIFGDLADPNSVANKANREAMQAMEQWLDNIASDRANDGDEANKVLRNKPATLVDACWTDSGARIDEPATPHGTGQCSTLFPAHANPRIVAGAPIADDVLKCRLKQMSARDYAVAFSDTQWSRLRALFPDGVCDYSRRGAQQHSIKDTWLAYPQPGMVRRLDSNGPHGSSHGLDEDD